MSASFIAEDGDCLNGPTGSKNPLPKPLFPLITKILLSFFILKSCNPSSTKIISGLAEPVLDTGREITRWAAMLIDAVGPDNAVNALDYIENNWPRADDIQYPNKSQPFNQDSAIQELTDELTQFCY